MTPDDEHITSCCCVHAVQKWEVLVETSRLELQQPYYRVAQDCSVLLDIANGLVGTICHALLPQRNWTGFDS